MASNYNKSNYGLNKNRKGIVYRNADGSTLEITFEKISATDPTFTKEDFDKLKSFSDEMYHEEEKSNCLYGKYIKGSYDNFDDSHWLQTIIQNMIQILSKRIYRQNLYCNFPLVDRNTKTQTSSSRFQRFNHP